MPTLEEVHLGIGSGECTFDYDPELLEELADFRHLVFYRQGKPFGTIVILSKTPSKDGITVSGYGLGWWLGVDNDGPVIENVEYIAGNNQLDNGGFEILDALGFPQWWNQSEGSKWAQWDSDNVHSGGFAVRTLADMGKDDVLISDQPRDVPVGALVRASAWAKRLSGTIGRLRLRTVYEGRYDPADLLSGYDYTDWTNPSEFSGDVSSIGADSFVLGPCTQPDYIDNGGFESGDFTDWLGNQPGSGGETHWLVVGSIPTGGTPISPYAGSWMAEAVAQVFPPDDTNQRWMGPVTGPGVSQGERYRYSGVIVEGPGTSGEASLILQCIRLTGTSENQQTSPINGSRYSPDDSPFHFTWKQVSLEYDVPEGVIALQPWLYASFNIDSAGIGGGEFGFDNISLVRIKGNTCKLRSPEISVTPERTYKLLVPLTGSWSGPAANGTVHAYVAFKGTGRTDQAVVSSAIDISQSATQTVISLDVTPPSGYDVVQITIVGTDLAGGSATVGRASLVDQNTSTYVVDKVIGPAGASWAQYTRDSTAPAGTQKVHLELVAEANGDGWAVDDVEWHRTETVDDPVDIVDDLLRDPDSGEYLVNPGTINDLGALQYDRVINNVPNRPALLALLRDGLLDAAREFRINADNTADVGLASELFAERTEFKFTEPDLLLLDRGEVAQTVEDRLTRVTVIGQALQRKAPLPDAVVTGRASTSIPDAYDWNNNPVSRTRIIEDSSVDFAAYADALASETLDRSADGGQAITLGISEWSAWGTFDCGDWLYIYKPEALLQDTDNPMTDKAGRRIFPARKRCLSRKLSMARGDGFEVRVRRPDGTEYPVDPNLVRWDDTTKATLELGDVRVDFANDPQGPAAGVAFARYRAQQAR